MLIRNRIKPPRALRIVITAPCGADRDRRLGIDHDRDHGLRWYVPPFVSADTVRPWRLFFTLTGAILQQLGEPNRRARLPTLTGLIMWQQEMPTVPAPESCLQCAAR